MYLDDKLYYFFSLVPAPTIQVTAPSNQMGRQPLTLQCNLTTVRGITSRVEFIWLDGSTTVRRVSNITAATITDNSTVYSDSLTIPSLTLAHNKRSYTCQSFIYTTPSLVVSHNLTLNVTCT